MKKIFLACTIQENNKYYSFVEVIRTGENLLNFRNRHKNLIIAHLCETRKQADELVTFWNYTYRRNGTYLFADPEF